MRIFLIIAYTLLNIFLCKGQSSDCPISITSSESSYKNYFSGGIVTHLNCLTLVNRTAEEYYFWIGRRNSHEVDTDRLFFSYFYGKGSHAIPFGDIVTDDANPLSSHAIQEIGYNFIKLLQPKEKFIILMPADEKKADFYRQRFVFMSKSELEHRIGTAIQFFTYKHQFLNLELAPINNAAQ